LVSLSIVATAPAARTRRASVRLTTTEAAFLKEMNRVRVANGLGTLRLGAALERAAHAVRRGAPLLTGSYAPGFAGADGIVLSRGAMVTAAIAKVSGARPKVVGKPSRAAVGELRAHFRLPTHRLAVIGDDLDVDVRLGRMGRSRTVLVRSGTAGSVELAQIPPRRRPDAVVDGVGDLLDRL
jgi:ribonucleotide monophosphatase NagD (HAD superfamily)